MKGEYMTKRKTAKKTQTLKSQQKLKTQAAQLRNSDDFIMLPTVDFCFKELMRNEKVRKGIISAILSVDPKDVEQTTLLPTILKKEHEEDKYGILDVLVQLKDGQQIDFEMQVETFDFWEKTSNILSQ